MILADWLAIVACLLSAAALAVAVRAFRIAEWAGRATRRRLHADGWVNLGPSRHAAPEPEEGGMPSGMPTTGPEQGSGESARTDTRELRIPRPGQL